jgi:ATP-dependent Clp protease ATP-binding subunit ClpB
VYGARPLKRALQKLVIDPLANHLLAGDFQSGDHLEGTVEGSQIVFHRISKGAAA